MDAQEIEKLERTLTEILYLCRTISSHIKPQITVNMSWELFCSKYPKHIYRHDFTKYYNYSITVYDGYFVIGG